MHRADLRTARSPVRYRIARERGSDRAVHSYFTHTLYGIRAETHDDVCAQPICASNDGIRSRTSLKARGRLALDIALFVAIVIAAHPEWTGISVHEWLSVALVLPALYHLAINWDWVLRVAVKVLSRLKATSRINFVVDVALFIATVTVMVTGMMVLPGLIPTSHGTVVLDVWRHAHSVSSDATILLMLAHFLLHAQWMSDALTRTLAPRPGRHARGRAGRLVRDRGSR